MSMNLHSLVLRDTYQISFDPPVASASLGKQRFQRGRRGRKRKGRDGGMWERERVREGTFNPGFKFEFRANLEFCYSQSK